jgi:hypothetical protein
MAQAHGENLKQAMDTLRTHKMRSALTVFGVVLGVSVIMLVAALLTGFRLHHPGKHEAVWSGHRLRFQVGPRASTEAARRWKSVCANR